MIHHACSTMDRWPSGLRRQTQVLISQDAGVRIPLCSLLVLGQQSALSRAYGVVVSHSLCMRKAAGSIPAGSIFVAYTHSISERSNTILIGLPAMIFAFHAEEPGSTPGWGTYLLLQIQPPVIRITSLRCARSSGPCTSCAPCHSTFGTPSQSVSWCNGYHLSLTHLRPQFDSG